MAYSQLAPVCDLTWMNTPRNASGEGILYVLKTTRPCILRRRARDRIKRQPGDNVTGSRRCHLPRYSPGGQRYDDKRFQRFFRPCFQRMIVEKKRLLSGALHGGDTL